MDIKFSHIEITNFMSYGNNTTIINLSTTIPTLITAKNFCSSSDGSDSNGSGKTTILNAVCFALYDKVLSDMPKDKLINNINKKNMLVVLYLSIDGVRYKIVRFRKNKHLGGDGVKIFKNGNVNWEFDNSDEFAPDSISNFNKLICKLIGKPFDVFSRIVVFSANHKPFLSLPSSSQNDANQIAILEELFGYTEVSEKAEILKEQVKDNKRVLDQEKMINDNIVAEHNRINQQITNLTKSSQTWVSEQKKSLHDIKTSISTLTAIDFKKQEELFTRINQLNVDINSVSQENVNLLQRIDNHDKTVKLSSNWLLNNDKAIKDLTAKVNYLASFDFDLELNKLSKLSELEVKATRLKSELSAANNLLHNQSKQLQKNASELKQLAKNECPYCQQNFADAKLKHSEICKQQDILKVNIDEQHGVEFLLSKQLDECSEEIELIKNTCKFTTNQLKSMKTDLTNNSLLLDQAKQATNPFEYDELFLETDAVEQNNIRLQTLKDELDFNKKQLKFDSERQMFQKQSELESLRKQLSTEKARLNPYIESLNQIKTMKLPETKEKEIDELTKLIEHQEFLVKLLTKKDSFIRKSLLQKNLPLLNTRLKIYLDKLGLPHKVLFLENMTAQIKQFDTELEYGQLSSGQKARINLALCFAFRDVLQYRHGSINFCMLDECLDVGLDNSGVQLAVRLIKEIAQEQKLSLFVISHRDEASAMFSNRLEIEYRNGFSNIK